MNGTPTQYGTVNIGANGSEINNSSYVTIAAAPGQTPNLYALVVTNANKFDFEGLTVSGLSSSSGAKNALGAIVSQGSGWYTSNIRINDLKGYTTDDTTRNGWSQADWATYARAGLYIGSSIPGSVTCVYFTNSEIKTTINYTLSLFSDNSVVEGNQLHDWAVDGIDYGGNNLIIKNNYLHDVYQLSDGSHVDGMQGFIGRPSYHDVLIDSNTVIYASNRHNFDTVAAVLNGGIDETDQDWTRVVVTNNVSIFPNHAIAFGDCHDCLIAGNTVLPARLFQDGDQHGGDITFEGQAKTYSVSSNAVIKNNFAGCLSISDPNAIVKNNVIPNGATPLCNSCIPAACGSGNSGFSTPGTYGDNNVVDSGGLASEVNAFDNSTTFTFDLRLLSTAAARGAGATTTPMPLFDITGAWRAPTHDAGAYVFQ